MTDFLFDSISVALPMSAVIALLLLLFRMYGRKLSAKCRRAVWLIVILRMCVPFSVQSVPALLEVTVPEELTVIEEAAVAGPIGIPHGVSDPVLNYDTPSAPVAAVKRGIMPESKLPAPPEIAAYIYIAGIIIFASYKAVMYTAYVYGLKRSLYSAGEELAALYSESCGRLGIKRAPGLFLSRNTDSPMLYGFFRPRVVLPESVSQLPVQSLTGILTHELTHYKRGDLLVKLSAVLATALYWWNPLVHIASARLSGECELACDECMLAGLDEDSRREYGNVMLGIIKSCKRFGGTLTTHFNPRRNAVKERFVNNMDMTKKRKGIWLIALALIICLIAGAVISCTIGETDKMATYERYGVKVPLPDEYSGKVTEADVETLPENVIITIYQTAAHKKSENMGWLFSIVRHSETELVPEEHNTGSLRYFAKDGEWYYALMRPTDVQADLSDVASAAEYEKLSAMSETVTADFIVVNRLEPYISGNIDISSMLSKDIESVQSYINALEKEYSSMQALIKNLQNKNDNLIYRLNNESGKITETEIDALNAEINNGNKQIAACHNIASEIDNKIKMLREHLDVLNGQLSYDTISVPGIAPPVEIPPPTDGTATVFMQTQNGDMPYDELLTYPEAQEVIVAQMNEILSGYNNGTLPNPIENYSESEPFRVSKLPPGVKLPRSIKWGELNVYVGNAMFPDKPIIPVYDDMYPYHIVLPLEGNWNLCVNAAVTSFERPENSTIQLYDLSFFYGDSYDKDDLQTYGHTEPYIHRAAFDNAVYDIVAQRYAGTAYQIDWLNREMTFSQLKVKLLFTDGRYVVLTFDIKCENGAESYVFTDADESDSTGASPYDIYVKYKIMLINPSQFLTDKQRSQIDDELKAVTGSSDIPTFAELYAGGSVIESGGSSASMRIGFTDGAGRKIAVTLLRFTASGEPFSPEKVTIENTWDDYIWKSVSCKIDGKSPDE